MSSQYAPLTRDTSGVTVLINIDFLPVQDIEVSAEEPRQDKQIRQVRSTQSSWKWLGRNWFIQSALSALVALSTSLYLRPDIIEIDFDIDSALDYFRPLHQDSYWESAREEVKDAFVDSWEAYSEYAWEQLSDARIWLNRGLTYDQNQEVNTFETTIRMLGGLLSAHYLSTQFAHLSSRRDYVYLQQAIDLADRLLNAYDTPSGIPWSSHGVNIGKRKGVVNIADNGASSIAEVTTLQMEMKYLAELTGNEVYWRKAEHIMKVVDDLCVRYGLVPIHIDPETGNFRNQNIRLGSRGDSYYEYLIKQYLHTYGHEPIYGEMWEEALEGIQKHLITTSKHSNLHFVAELPFGIGSTLSPKMDHLVCFLPGSIAIGVTEGRTESEARKLPTWSTQKEKQMELARELMKTCYAMYAVTASGLSAEISWFRTDEADLMLLPGLRSRPRSSNNVKKWKKDLFIRPPDAHNLQRPETVEILFLMFRVTEDPMYRQWGLKIFRAFQRHTGVVGGKGYTSLSDVTKNPPIQRDNMESFWLSETLKYLYLLFSPTEYLPLTEIVFNTEAHPFPRLKNPTFQTGWSRKKRT